MGIQREDIVRVLQQHHRLLSSLKRLGSKLLTTELLISLTTRIGLLKETKTVFHAEDAAHGIVDTCHRDLPFLNKFLQQDTELHAIRIHRHVDTGIDGDADGVFLVLGHMLTGIEVVDISPVGHQHTIPLQVLLQPFRQIFIAGMNRYAID